MAWVVQMLTAADLADESTDLQIDDMTMAVELAARWEQRPFLIHINRHGIFAEYSGLH